MKYLIFVILVVVSLLQAPSLCADESVKFENEIPQGLSGVMDIGLTNYGHLVALRSGGIITFFDSDNKPQLSYNINPSGSQADKVISPNAFAITAKGLLVLADNAFNRVLVYNVAGELQFSFGAQGNLPGQFKSISGIDVDVLGFIYTTDFENKRIQVFTPKGIFMRSIPLSGSPADVSVDRRGNIFVLLPKQGKIEKYDVEGVKTLEIVCQDNNRDEIAKANKLFVDPYGDIYLTQWSEERIVKIDQQGTNLISFGSEGNARGQFSGIGGLVANESGNVFVADSANSRIQIFKVIGSGKSPIPVLKVAAYYLDFDSVMEAQDALADIFVRPGNGLFGLSDKLGTVRLWAGGDFNLTSEDQDIGQLGKPSAIYVTLNGRIYIADTGNNRVLIYNPDGTFSYQFGKNGNKPGQFNSPQGIAVNGNGLIYVADTLNHRVQVFNQDGIYLNTIGEPRVKNDSVQKAVDSCQILKSPKSIATDSKDYLYVLDAEIGQINVYDENDQCLRTIGEKGKGFGQFTKPVDIAIDENDNLYVADSADSRVQIFSSNGSFILSFGSQGTGNGYFRQISSVTTSDGRIYVSDYQSPAIQIFKYAPDGIIGISERLYSTKTAPPSEGIEINDVVRYTKAREAAFKAATSDFIESFGFTEEYLMRFIRIESIERLNDGQVKVTVSIPKYIPKELIPLENSGLNSGGS